eukprot:COSAG02_NODE_2038_length_10038_cov_3.193480_8_plen_479_part_00
MSDRISQLKATTQQQQLGVEEQLSLVKFLRHAVQYKDEQIATLQGELATIRSAADAQRESIEMEKQGEIDEAQHKLTISELECKRLEGELQSFRTLEPEVNSLRQEVDELQQTLGRERREHEAQLRRLGDDYQQYRGALQEQFSAMVHSNGLVDLSSKSGDNEANSDSDSDAMVSEAMRAAQAQAMERIEQLGTELLVAQRAGDAAMERHGELQTALSKLKLDYDVQAESLREQTRTAVRYKKNLAAVTAKLERFEKQAEKMSSRPTSAGTLASGSSLQNDHASTQSSNGELPARMPSAASTRSAGSIGSAGSRGSRARSAGNASTSSRRGGKRPVSRAGSELSDFLEKRGLRARELQNERQTALSPGMDMSAWAEAAVQGATPPNVAPPLTGVWSSNPDHPHEGEIEYGHYENDGMKSPVGSLRSEPSLKSLDSELSSGSGSRRTGTVSGGPRRSFRHAMLTESRPSSRGSGRFLAP